MLRPKELSYTFISELIAWAYLQFDYTVGDGTFFGKQAEQLIRYLSITKVQKF